jgi:hypothetical protein
MVLAKCVPPQVRTHAQKLMLRQQKEQAGVMQVSSNGRELPPVPPRPTGAPSSALESGELSLLPSDGVGDADGEPGLMTDLTDPGTGTVASEE